VRSDIYAGRPNKLDVTTAARLTFISRDNVQTLDEDACVPTTLTVPARARIEIEQTGRRLCI